MSQELASYLSFYVTVISIIRPAVIIAILIGLWAALRRTDLTPAARTGTWLAIALALATWFVFIWNAALAGAFEPRPGVLPFLPVAIVLPIIIALPLLTRSQRIAAAIDAAPASWLIGLQVYRVVGANFLILWAYGGAISGVFALPAGVGDVLTALLALPAALYAARPHHGDRVEFPRYRRLDIGRFAWRHDIARAAAADGLRSAESADVSLSNGDDAGLRGAAQPHSARGVLVAATPARPTLAQPCVRRTRRLRRVRPSGVRNDRASAGAARCSICRSIRVRTHKLNEKPGCRLRARTDLNQPVGDLPV
jgi:hypothetical protein